jgi:chemotaxis protein methyltransferase CheR
LAFTFFFRDQQVLERVVEHSLPIMAGRNHPRIWDAGVAMGQEPYTVSIMFAERMGHFAFNNLRIDATDVESTGQFAQIIEAGLYPQEELSRLPEGILEKYFEANGKPGHFRVIDKVRQRVAFQRHDLLSCKEIGHDYSLVLCKNVLLHFQPPERIEVLKMFHRALVPGGLFATEQTQEMPRELASLFERVIPDGQLFRKVEASACGS